MEMRVKLEYSGSKIVTKLEYITEDHYGNPLQGEMDLGVILLNDKLAKVYEVKTHDNYWARLKANTQLDKDERYIFENYIDIQIVEKYFVYSSIDCSYCIERVYDD